ncbi:trigger factor [Roseomonas elaeocarpi]|uniref:Trigger factor n=1 Tax=Roseomonas elaeocarpi TaxID=907779 RepID=A0ABV6JS61_9PROT
MQVTEVATEGLKRSFDVVVQAAEVEAARDKRLVQVAKDLRIPGFRPGKVPMSVVKGRYGAAVTGEVLEERVQDATRQLLNDRGLKPAQQPKIDLQDFAEGKDLAFRVEMEVLPEIPMPEFGTIEVERLKAEPTDEEVNKALEGLAGRAAKLEDVNEDRAATTGDTVVVDFTGRARPKDEPEGELVAFEGGSGTDMPVEIGGTGFIPGFSEGLDGIKVGETRHVEVTFPAEYHAPDLAGRPATFEMTAKALKKSVKPEMDDEFAKNVGVEGGIEELRTQMKAILQNQYDQVSRMKVKRQLLDALAERADFPVPQGMVDAEFEGIWQRVEADLKAGRLDEEDKGKDEATLRDEYRKIAERRIRLGLLVSEIGRTNNVQVAQDELARAVRAEAGRYPGQERQVVEYFQKNPQAIEGLRAPLFEEKVVDFMLELAKVNERVVPSEELQADAASA